MKKFKLLVSVASMCLAVAVLCFGVFAATNSINYQISGQVKYEINESIVDITTKVYYSKHITSNNLISSDIETYVKQKTNLLTCDIRSNTPTGVTLDSSTEYKYNSVVDEGAPSYTVPDKEFTNEKQIYYFVVHIENLVSSGTASNVYATANVSSVGSNLVGYTSERVPQIKKGSGKNIVFAVGVSSIGSSFELTKYSFGVILNIGDLPITAYINGTQMNQTVYGMTFEQYMTNNSNTKLTTDASGNVLYDGSQLYNVTTKVTKSTVITDKANYSTSERGKLYENKQDGYWFLYYGTYNNNPIMWKYVGTMDSNGTMAKYTYSSTKPTGLAGKGVFVQQSLSDGGDVAFDTNNSSNYYTSSIRTKIKDGTYFNLSEEEKTLDLAMPRTISSIKGVSSSSSTSSPSYQETTTDQYTLGDSSTDKFWLMSLGEVNTYLGTTNESRKFNDQYWWLRSPLSGSTNGTMSVVNSGSLYNYGAFNPYCRVRAAFILSADATL